MFRSTHTQTHTHTHTHNSTSSSSLVTRLLSDCIVVVIREKVLASFFLFFYSAVWTHYELFLFCSACTACCCSSVSLRNFPVLISIRQKVCGRRCVSESFTAALLERYLIFARGVIVMFGRTMTSSSSVSCAGIFCARSIADGGSSGGQGREGSGSFDHSSR
jgi:hypothetical protein